MSISENGRWTFKIETFFKMCQKEALNPECR